MILGSLQVFATVLRSLMPWPWVISFSKPFSARDKANNCKGPGVLPEDHVVETLPKVLNEDFARFSMRLTAFSARGAIHSDEHTTAGSGVEAQALRSTSDAVAATERKIVLMTEA